MMLQGQQNRTQTLSGGIRPGNSGVYIVIIIIIIIESVDSISRDEQGFH